ncbi:ATP-binding protein [candidate division KSB1 bacterium]
MSSKRLNTPAADSTSPGPPQAYHSAENKTGLNPDKADPAGYDDRNSGKDRYRELVDKARDAIYISSREGKILDINQAGLDLFGYNSLDEMKDLYIPRDIYADPRDRAQLIKIMQKQGFVQDMELTFKRKDGAPIEILLTSNARRNSRGRVTGYEGFVRDVTEIKRMQAALEDTNRRLGEMLGRLALYNKITEAAHRIEDFDELLSRITVLIREGLEVSRDCVILRVNGSDGLAERLAFAGLRKKEAARELIDCLHESVDDSGKAIRRQRLKPEPVARVRRLKQAIAADILYRGQPSGMLVIASGRRGPFLETESTMIEEIVDRLPAIIHHRLLVEHLKQSSGDLREKINRLSLIGEISRLWGTHMNLEEILHMILVGVTAGEGLGFNRAFLLLVNQETNRLEGKMAIGASDSGEARRIWKEIDRKKLSLEELMKFYQDSMDKGDARVNEIINDISIDLKSGDNFFILKILQGEPYNVTDSSTDSLVPEDFSARLGAPAFACVPLMVRGEVLGALVVDNLITGKTIRGSELDQLWIFASHAAQAIMNSQLYQRLSDRMADLRKAYGELKTNRDRLVRTERLTAVGEVATDVAHEIRNPLASIGGFARRLRRQFSEETSQHRQLGIIVDEVDRLEKFLSEVLEFARPSTPRFKMTDLNRLIMETFRMMEGDIDPDRHIVRTNLQPDLQPIRVDTDQIRQVLLNLFANAVKAMPEGGELLVSSKTLDNFVQARISDTGIGIPPGHLDKLFSPFFTTRSSGSGLGLSISRQIIRNHGGSINVESEEGAWTTFIINLPTGNQTAPEERERE